VSAKQADLDHLGIDIDLCDLRNYSREGMEIDFGDIIATGSGRYSRRLPIVATIALAYGIVLMAQKRKLLKKKLSL